VEHISGNSYHANGDSIRITKNYSWEGTADYKSSNRPPPIIGSVAARLACSMKISLSIAILLSTPVAFDVVNAIHI